MRSMELVAGGRPIYTSNFDPKSGTLVRTVEVSADRYRNRWEDDKEFEKRYPNRRYSHSAFSPVPETIDVSITDKCHFGCAYCLSPSTPVLGADLLWRPISSIQPGDILAGFDEFADRRRAHRKLRASVVQAVRITKRPVLRIITDTREVHTTGNHGWLQHYRGVRWQAAERLRVGNALSLFGEPFTVPEPSDDYRLGYLSAMTLGDGTFRFEPGWKNWSQGFPQAYWRVALKDEQALGRIVAYLARFGVESNIRPFNGGPSSRSPMQKVEIRSISRLETIHAMVKVNDRDTTEFKRGWLAGFFDAEGSHDESLRYTQKALEPLERVVRYAATLGFTFKIEPPSPASVASNARLKGTVQERMRFLGYIQPAITRKTTDWVGTALEIHADTIRAIEKVGEMDVVDIQTSSSTFFAGGLATHNCYQDSRPKRAHGPKELVETIINGFDQPPYQVAIGGGEPTIHPDFKYIVKSARELGTVPNYTTAGDRMTPDIIALTNEFCGGVAMTFHAFKGIDWFVPHYLKLRESLKVQLNVHLICDKDVAKNLLTLVSRFDQIGSLRLVLLAYYPDVGRATLDGLMTKRVYHLELPEAIKAAHSAGYTIAVSEGMLPYVFSRPELKIDTRFAMKSEGNFSCYFDPRGRISTSSFNPPYDGKGPSRFKGDNETVFNTRSQKLWDELRAGYGPSGNVCAECQFESRCATPEDIHYLACAFTPHNKTPLKPVAHVETPRRSVYDHLLSLGKK